MRRRRGRGWGGKESPVLVAVMEIHLIALVFTITLVSAAGAADPGKHRISLARIIMYNFPAFYLFPR